MSTKRSRPGSNPNSAANLKKRERKTPVHLKNTFKPMKPKKNLSIKSVSKNDVQAIKTMIDKLISDDREKFFSSAVDPVRLNLPDYFQVIKCPMDLGTVLDKMKNNQYLDTDVIISDVRLTFQNAMLYNPKKHPVHSIAKMHLNHFERDLKNFIRLQEKKEKQAMQRRNNKSKMRDKFKSKKNGESMIQMQKVLEAQNQKFQKSKKKILDMFDSSDEAASSDSDDEMKDTTKKKRKKGKSGEFEYMKNMVSMMSNQLEMMQQWQNTSLQEITRLNQELIGTKRESNAHMNAITASYSPPVPVMQPQSGMLPSYGNPGIVFDQASSNGSQQHQRAAPKKPKVARPLTISQMKQLSEDIHKLGPDDVVGLLEVVSGHGELVSGGEEMELDIENMKPEVARACYKYVSKKISKAKNNADISELQFDDS